MPYALTERVAAGGPVAAPAHAPTQSPHSPANRIAGFMWPPTPSGKAPEPSRYFRAFRMVGESALVGTVRLVAFEVVWFGNLNPKSPALFASIGTLAERTGLGRRTVERALAVLEKIGLLVRDGTGYTHGRSSGAPVRYRVDWAAFAQAVAMGKDGAVAGVLMPKKGRRGTPQRRGGYATVAYKQERQENTKEGLLPPSCPPSGDLAPDPVLKKEDSQNQSPEPEAQPNPTSEAQPVEKPRRTVAGNRQRERAALARSWGDNASPVEDAIAGLYEAGWRGDCQRLVEAVGPVIVAEVLAKVRQRRRGRGVRNGGALVTFLLKTDYPEAWSSWESVKPKGGQRGNRLRKRDGGGL